MWFYSEQKEIMMEQKKELFKTERKKVFNILWKTNGGRYRNGLKEGSGAYGKAGLWVWWWRNGQKQVERDYYRGKCKIGLWKYWDKEGKPNMGD